MGQAGDPDGLSRTPRRGGFAARAMVGVAVVALLGVAGYLALRPPQAAAPDESAAPLPAAQEPQAARAPAPQPAVAPDPLDRAYAEAFAKAEAARGPDAGPTKEIWVSDLPPGEKTGLRAFNKPGTKPLKGGLLVPDGFELPPGYVRHYQTTDDGRALPAILMFHPDYVPRGPDGKPLPIPPDRIVPPELAPPGMPLQSFEPPAIREDLEK